MFPKRVEQTGPRINLERVFLAIDLEREFRCGRGGRRSSRARIRGFGATDSEECWPQADRCAGPSDLFQKMAARRRASEDQEIIETAGQIDCKIGRHEIVLLHSFLKSLTKGSLDAREKSFQPE